MKKILLMLALCGCAAPAFAQEAPPPAEKEKTTQELLEELHKIMKDASKEMGAAETELAKTEHRFDDSMSPPIFLVVTLLLSLLALVHIAARTTPTSTTTIATFPSSALRLSRFDWTPAPC